MDLYRTTFHKLQRISKQDIARQGLRNTYTYISIYRYASKYETNAMHAFVMTALVLMFSTLIWHRRLVLLNFRWMETTDLYITLTNAVLESALGSSPWVM